MLFKHIAVCNSWFLGLSTGLEGKEERRLSSTFNEQEHED
jgi:hypothetical protein